VATGIALLLKLGQDWRWAGGYLLCAALLGTLAILTWRQSAMYSDIETLWQTTIKRNPAAWMAHDNLGAVLLKKGQLEEAAVHFRKALEINADDVTGHANLGNVLLQHGQVDEAIAQYRKALEIKPSDAEIHYDLGGAFLHNGQLDDAIAQYQKALEIKPGYADAYNNLGLALFQKGQLDDAIAQYQKALTGGASPTVLRILAAAYAQAGKYAEAVETAQHCLQLATAQNNSALADAVRTEIEFYQDGLPYRIGK
jgi:tetratricopeptide (TPR) repeat protein